MQSRHNVTGIQYQGGMMSDYINISLPAERIARTYLRVSVLPCVAFLWTVFCFSMNSLSLHLTMAEMPEPCFPSVWDIKGCQHSPPSLTSPFVQTWAQLMHPICPLWAPIHQPLTHRRVSERGDHLLFKCLKGLGEGGSRGSQKAHFYFWTVCRNTFESHCGKRGAHDHRFLW